MKERIKYYFKNFRSVCKFYKFFSKKENNLDFVAAELIRGTHSIEKGLSINNIRLGFGHQKQEKMLELIELLYNQDNEYYDEVISMAVTAMVEYIKYHDEQKYTDDFIEKLREELKKYNSKIKENYGGVIKVNARDLTFDTSKIENFFKTRHSVRNFSDRPVDEKIIKKAIKLAQTCPSACNRQGVRVHVIDKEKVGFIVEKLNGIGGFAKEIDKMIIVTAKLSSYRFDEINQFIVSSSIFAGYLSLTLHLYGLGSCIIQRPVIWTEEWEKTKKVYNIPDDEQVVCMLGVGNVIDEFFVPKSHRLSEENFANYIK